MIRATIEKNGNLKITADNEGRSVLKDCYADDGYWCAESEVFSALYGIFYEVFPEWIAALTDAPILCESDGYTIEDDGAFTLYPESAVWWFPDYCIRDPWEELKNTGRVVFQRAEESVS